MKAFYFILILLLLIAVMAVYGVPAFMISVCAIIVNDIWLDERKREN